MPLKHGTTTIVTLKHGSTTIAVGKHGTTTVFGGEVNVGLSISYDVNLDSVFITITNNNAFGINIVSNNGSGSNSYVYFDNSTGSYDTDDGTLTWNSYAFGTQIPAGSMATINCYKSDGMDVGDITYIEIGIYYQSQNTGNIYYDELVE